MASFSASNADFLFRAGPLMYDELRVVGFKAEEEMSSPFEVWIELACEDRDLDMDKLVGQPGTLSIAGPDADSFRFINGIVSRMEYRGDGVRFARYKCKLTPFLWLLDLRQKSRIFQDLDVKAIITKVMTDAGMTSDMFRMATTKTYPKREYCVQYRETDLDFIQRLMEEEGIFYFFEHTEMKHVMVLGDKPTASTPIIGNPIVLFRGPSAMVQGEEFISSFRMRQQVRSGAVMLKDFKPEQPKLNLDAKKQAKRDTTLEIYDYPGEYDDPGVGTALAQIRLEELQTKLKVAFAVGVCRRLMAGYRFTMKDHVRTDFNIEYLITSISHEGNQPQVLDEEPEAATPKGPLYECRIEAIPFSVPFRPARTTERPTVMGTQTAIVVGPSGEEIYTDSLGRVKVHFHWDREGNFDEKASCWIRVSQAWAGGKYGTFFLPRIGHEVIVDFLEGDPDRPIIVGTVYNGDQMPPYALPDEKTKLVIKTTNSKGQDGANELRFEDKHGSEEVFLHAFKDLNIRAKATRTQNIEGDSHDDVGGEHRETIAKNRSLHVKKDEAILIDGNSSEHVTKALTQKVDGAHTITVGGDFLLNVTGKVLIKGGGGVRLEGPGGAVTIAAAGVYVKGTMVYINSGDSPVVVTAGNAAAPADPGAAPKATPGKDTSYTGNPSPPPPTPVPPLPPGSWIGVSLKYVDGTPAPGEAFTVITTDNKKLYGKLNINGESTLVGIKPGACKVSFPNRHPDEWKKA